jgi:afadin
LSPIGLFVGDKARKFDNLDFREIIETLIEKFRPDMKMLEVPEYALYEIHESGERRLGLEEKPLLVQVS